MNKTKANEIKMYFSDKGLLKKHIEWKTDNLFLKLGNYSFFLIICMLLVKTKNLFSKHVLEKFSTPVPAIPNLRVFCTISHRYFIIYYVLENFSLNQKYKNWYILSFSRATTPRLVPEKRNKPRNLYSVC